MAFSQPSPRPSDNEAQYHAKLTARRNQIRTRSIQDTSANALRKKTAIDQLPSTQQEDDTSGEDGEIKQKNRLALVKSAALNILNKEGGAAAGAAAGGALGSAVPIVGNIAGAAVGRFIGKRLGVTGIVILSLMTFFFWMFLVVIVCVIVLKGYCDSQGIISQAATNVAAFFETPGASEILAVCKSLTL